MEWFIFDSDFTIIGKSLRGNNWDLWLLLPDLLDFIILVDVSIGFKLLSKPSSNIFYNVYYKG